MLRYDETKADLVHDEEYEAVLFPLGASVDVTRAVAVDYDDRDLRDTAPGGWTYRLSDAPISESAFWKQVQRDLVDHLARSLSLEIPVNRDLKLYGRPGEDAEAFTTRCLQVADEKADAEIAKLRDKYEKKATTLRDRIDAAADAAEVAADQQQARERDNLLSSAGSILGGLLGGRGHGAGSSARSGGPPVARRGAPPAGHGSRRRRTRSPGCRPSSRRSRPSSPRSSPRSTPAGWSWPRTSPPLPSTLERTDVKVTHLALAWIPTS